MCVAIANIKQDALWRQLCYKYNVHTCSNVERKICFFKLRFLAFISAPMQYRLKKKGNTIYFPVQYTHFKMEVESLGWKWIEKRNGSTGNRSRYLSRANQRSNPLRHTGASTNSVILEIIYSSQIIGVSLAALFPATMYTMWLSFMWHHPGVTLLFCFRDI